MFEETLYQNCRDGTPFVDVLMKQGIYPGIKVGRAAPRVHPCMRACISEASGAPSPAGRHDCPPGPPGSTPRALHGAAHHAW